ncbi:MAG: DsbE family thiol:disulfide interchange protein [Pseudomonadota bacterium]
MKMRFMIPLAVFVVLAVFLGLGLKLNPREIPSPLIGKPAPDFRLPRLHDAGQSFSPEDFKGKVWLLNVWASWCASCRTEHPVLNAWAGAGEVEIVGLNYKDDSESARQWLAQLGNPYMLSVMDRDGRAGIDWGVYGVPETFVIDKHGIIRHKHTGPISAEDIQTGLRPLVRRLKDGK